MKPPTTTHVVALHVRVMFAAAFDGLRVGEVRHGMHLPISPWPRHSSNQQCNQCGAEILGYHACLGVPDEQ